MSPSGGFQTTRRDLNSTAASKSVWSQHLFEVRVGPVQHPIFCPKLLVIVDGRYLNRKDEVFRYFPPPFLHTDNVRLSVAGLQSPATVWQSSNWLVVNRCRLDSNGHLLVGPVSLLCLKPPFSAFPPFGQATLQLRRSSTRCIVRDSRV